jgi:hypothetical protein
MQRSEIRADDVWRRIDTFVRAVRDNMVLQQETRAI